MKIVIDIPDTEISIERAMDTITLFFKNGHVYKCNYPFKELPKGHGAIIDIKELEGFWKKHEIGHSAFNGKLLYDAGRTSRHDVIWKPLLDVLPTIIEADK